jgi:hypothetical protein
MSSWSECFMIRGSMRLRGSMNLEVKVSARFNILLYHSLTLLELFEVLFLRYFFHLRLFEKYCTYFTSLSNYSLHSLCCHQSSKRGGLCASRPSRYVSVINDNHYWLLMTFMQQRIFEAI